MRTGARAASSGSQQTRSPCATNAASPTRSLTPGYGPAAHHPEAGRGGVGRYRRPPRGNRNQRSRYQPVRAWPAGYAGVQPPDPLRPSNTARRPRHAHLDITRALLSPRQQPRKLQTTQPSNHRDPTARPHYRTLSDHQPTSASRALFGVRGAGSSGSLI